MIEQIYTYFTIEMIYFWLNIGVLPFWLILIFFPQAKICKIFTISIFPIFILSLIYCYLIYKIFQYDYDFSINLRLYLGINEISNLFSNNSFLILFWVHFLSINLFCGAWIVNDYQKFGISKILMFLPLVITYFVGPIGIFVYWILRIFYAKKLLSTTKIMKSNFFKKLFIKISKMLGYEIIDQNEFFSPTLEKKLNDDLSIINDKSIVLPLGEVKVNRKIKSILTILRINTEIEVWDQNKKRLFEFPKIEYTLRSLNSLIKSINFSKEKYPSINHKIIIVDDNSTKENISKINKLIDGSNIKIDLINLNSSDYNNVIKKQKSEDTFSNLSSLLKCYELAKEQSEDLIFFVEDDYLHFLSMMEEMIASYERISSQLEKDFFMCPSDYPYLYMNNQKTNILIGNKRHWRTVDRTLCTFMTTKFFIDKYWNNFYNNCLDRHDPFEKYLNEIYEKEFCISPLKSLSVHITNVNSSYGLSPFIDYKKIWDENLV